MEQDNARKETPLDPIMELAVSQQKLGSIPFSIAQETTIGAPLRDVIVRLEKVKQAILPVLQQLAKAQAEAESKKPGGQKKAAQKVVPLPKSQE